MTTQTLRMTSAVWLGLMAIGATAHAVPKSTAHAVKPFKAQTRSAKPFKAHVGRTAKRVKVHTSHPSHPTAQGSFLGALVYTVPDLLVQVEAHPAIAARYARHYHMSPTDVIAYMKANLVESYMPRTQVFQTYWVRKSGQIHTGPQRLIKGTRVFALRNGQPVLKWACGNPLTSSLPRVKTEIGSSQQELAMRISPQVQTLVPSETTDIYVPSESPDTVVANEQPDTVTFSDMATSSPQVLVPPIPIWGAIATAAPVVYGITRSTTNISQPAPTPETPTTASFGALAGLGVLFLRRRRTATTV